MASYYELLNVDRDADREAIKRAFYRLAKQFHPDVSKKSTNFLKILNAYKTLTDDYKRERYDSMLEPLERIILSKERLCFAVSLSDIARRRYYRPAGSRRRGSAYKLKGYDVCVNLTEGELASGAAVLVDVPAHVICPLCGGNHMHCNLCSDRGYILKAVPIRIDIPRDLSDNEVFAIPLRRMRGREFAFYLIKELSVKIKIFQG